MTDRRYNCDHKIIYSLDVDVDVVDEDVLMLIIKIKVKDLKTLGAACGIELEYLYFYIK